MDYETTRLRGAMPRRPDSPGGDEQLFERAVGERGAAAAPSRPSLLQPQQDRNVIWRWHVRRRRSKA